MIVEKGQGIVYSIKKHACVIEIKKHSHAIYNRNAHTLWRPTINEFGARPGQRIKIIAKIIKT